MQISDAPHTLPGIIYALLGALAVGIPALLLGLFNRGKTGAEAKLSIAQALKAEAETRSLDMEASRKAAETIIHLMDKLRSTERELEEARAEIKRLSGNGRVR